MLLIVQISAFLVAVLAPVGMYEEAPEPVSTCTWLNRTEASAETPVPVADPMPIRKVPFPAVAATVTVNEILPADGLTTVLLVAPDGRDVMYANVATVPVTASKYTDTVYVVFAASAMTCSSRSRCPLAVAEMLHAF
jgi:hypothetical protein